MRFLIGVVTGLCITTAVWLMAIYLQVGNPVLSSRWVFDVYTKKEKLATKARQPRMLIVAGSNALFGIDSSMLEKRYRMDVVNMGVNAGLLLPYVLYEAMKILHPGDVVLLPLEYPMFTYDGRPNEQMISYLYAFDPNFFWFLTWKERILVLWDTPLTRIFEGYIKTGTNPITNGIYGAHRIDANGDQTGTSASAMTDADKKAVASYGPHDYGKNFSKDVLAWEYLEAFVTWAKERDICLIFIPSVLMDFPYYHSNPRERYFYTHLPDEARKHGLCYLGRPFDFFYPRTYFFNTDYHLTAEARELNTRKIISLLGNDPRDRCCSKSGKL